MRAAVKHIEFCILIYRHQLREGRHLVHEHPWGASSWKLDCVDRLMDDDRVYAVEAHQYMFGLTSHMHSKSGERGMVKKPTGFMTTAKCMADQLNRQCDGSHSHVHMIGCRAAGTQVYPKELCEAILRGVVGQKRQEYKMIAMPTMSSIQLKHFIGSIVGMEIQSLIEEHKKHSLEICPKNSTTLFMSRVEVILNSGQGHSVA